MVGGSRAVQSMPNHKDGSAAFFKIKLTYDKFHCGGLGLNDAFLGVLLCIVVC